MTRMNARPRRASLRMAALAPIVLGLGIGTGLCALAVDDASAIEPDTVVTRPVAERGVVINSPATALRAAYHHLDAERVPASPCSRRARAERTAYPEGPSMRAAAPVDNATSTKLPSGRSARYGFFAIMIVAWYALGVTLMPWVLPRKR